MLEEAARRELLRHRRRSTAVDRHQRPEQLGGGPVQRAEIVHPVVRADAEAFRCGIDIAQVFAEIEDHAFRLRAGAGGEQDHGVVVRPGRGMSFARRAVRDRLEKGAGAGLVPLAQRQPRHRNGGEQIVELQAILVQHQLRIEAREDVVKLITVHFDVNSADRRTVAHHTEIAEQVLDRVVGKQRGPVVASDVAVAQEGGDAGRHILQLAVGGGSPIGRRDQPDLVRIAACRPADPVSQHLWTGIRPHGIHPLGKILSIISILPVIQSGQDSAGPRLTRLAKPQVLPADTLCLRGARV